MRLDSSDYSRSGWPLLVLSAVVGLISNSLAYCADTAARLPHVPTTFQVPFSLPTEGKTWQVKQGDNLQTVIDDAALGDVIVLPAGATFTGNFKLPAKTGSGWIYIVSSELKSLPAGKRVKPADAVHMPKIVTASVDPTVFTVFAAHNYRFAGVELRADANNYNLVLMGWGLDNYRDALWKRKAADSLDKLPYDIVFDRCYLHSTSAASWARTGINADGKYIAVTDCCLENFKDHTDSQAIQIWNGPGPYKIVNNSLEASGENIMSGGTDPTIQNLVPADFEIRGNYLCNALNGTQPTLNTSTIGVSRTCLN